MSKKLLFLYIASYKLTTLLGHTVFFKNPQNLQGNVCKSVSGFGLNVSDLKGHIHTHQLSFADKNVLKDALINCPQGKNMIFCEF